MGRRGKRRDRRQEARQGQAQAWGPASSSDAPTEEPQERGVPLRHTIVIPRTGVAGWVAAAALTRHPYWKGSVEPGARIVRAAMGPHWMRDLEPPPDAEEPGEPLSRRFEREGYLLLGVGDGAGVFEGRGPEQVLERVCMHMAAGFSEPGDWVRGDPKACEPWYPGVAPTPEMVVRVLWLLADRGKTSRAEAEEGSRVLAGLLFDRMVSGGLNKPETANIPALSAWMRLQRRPWTFGKTAMRAALATRAWLRQAEADWSASGRLVTVGLPDASGTLGPLALAVCRSPSPLAAAWIREHVQGADVAVRVEDGGFFAQVIGNKGAVRERLIVAAGRLRLAFHGQRLSEQRAAQASAPGFVDWSPIYLDQHGACVANRHEGDPYLGDLPFGAAELETRFIQALEFA